MGQRSVVAVVVAAAQAGNNAIWEAMDRGPGTFSVPLSANGQEPATHYLMHDGSATDEDAIAWQAMTDGTLPTLTMWGQPITWGQNGVISEQDAIDAAGGGNLEVWSRAGGTDPGVHVTAVLTGLSLQQIVVE